MKSFSALVLLLALFASGEALKCYYCVSQANSTCGDPFKQSDKVEERDFPLINCLCTKTVTELTNATYIERGCKIPIEGDLLTEVGKPGKGPLPVKTSFTYFCDKDRCNGASSFSAAVFTTMGLATALLVSKWI